MAIMYRKYQGKSVKNQKTFGKWYARSVMVGTVTTDELAAKIEANCSMKRSDVLGVLSEMAVILKEELGNSKRVAIDGLGTFKTSLKTSPASTSKDFNASKNVKRVSIIFQPKTTVSSDGKRVKKLLEGCTVMELPKNAVIDKAADETDEVDNG